MSTLEGQISDLVKSAESKTAEIAALRMEINRLRAAASNGAQFEHEEVLRHLTCENQQLKYRLVAVSAKVNTMALSETEQKDTALKGHYKCFSAPPSIIGNTDTSSWEKGSASSCALSEISVACLQDRIIQMEENHYCTNEELQATLQELTDLQDQLTDLKEQNEQLTNDKRVILESLYSQTEKLEDARSHNNSLKQLLLSKNGDGEGSLTCSEREQHLLDVLRAGQEEKDLLLLKQAEFEERLSRNEDAEKEHIRETILLRDRLKMLESALECSQAERRLLEKQIRDLRTRDSSECARLRRLLDGANARIQELEVAFTTSSSVSSSIMPVEMEHELATLRMEKDSLEVKVSTLHEELETSVAENAKLREQLLRSQEEGRVGKNKAAQEIHDLEYRIAEVLKEKTDLVSHLTERVEELEKLCQRHLEDKRELKVQIQSQLSENQKLIADYTQHITEREKKIDDVIRRHRTESLEWSQFQSDLLMTVRVANDFKTEAQHNLERLLQENRSLRDRIQSLRIEIDRLKTEKPGSPSPLNLRAQTAASGEAIATLERELQTRRLSRPSASRQESRVSVRSLIESIETSTRSSRLGSCATPSSVTSPLSASACSSLAGSCASLGGGSSGADNQSVGSGASGNGNGADASGSSATCGNGQIPGSPGVPTLKGDASSTSSSIKASGVIVGLKTSGSFTSEVGVKPSQSILSKRTSESLGPKRTPLYPDTDSKVDPLAQLAKNGGSRRNALLKWCQMKTLGYSGVDITNFSSSWNDGLAFCALLHSYLPEKIDFAALCAAQEKRRNFQCAFAGAESVGIPTTLDVTEMVTQERPDWQKVMAYVAAIYIHFETDHR